MEVKAVTKYVRLSPSKARDITRAIQGQSAARALSVAQTSQRKAAKLICKTLRSAIANAEANKGLSADALYVKSAVVEEGPRYKRYWPRARGSVSPIQRRMSHIRIILCDERLNKRS